MAAAGNQKKPEYTLEDWTISSSAVQVPQRPPKTRLSDAEVLQWAQGPVGASTGSQSGWRIEILIADFDRPNLEPLAQLVVALGGRREDAIAPFRPLGTFTEPFPSFQAHRSARTDPQLVDVSRHFCLLDGIDNTYWVSFPRDRCTKVVACARSPKDFWTERFHELVHTTLQKDLCHPVAAGVAVLIADVEPFNGGVRACIDGLRALHLETGLHQLSGITTEAHDPNNLGEMTKDVCGYTMNLHTYTLGLRRLHRFADFLLQECDIAESAAGQSPDGTDTVVRDIHVEILRSHTSLRPFLEAWKRRAHGLLEEAESWENRASILVQTVFTLSTQRDTGVSIEIARDSRTLAQQGIRDSNSMKAIAAVTMCFLPGTFVASFFAMPMFDWDIDPGQTVSSHFWVYWAVTLPLTFIVLAVWLIWINRQDVESFMRRLPARRGARSKASGKV